MPSQPRKWTAEEEKLMLRQSLGEFSMFRLEKALRSSRESIIMHMLSLGYRPLIQRRRSNGGAGCTRAERPVVDIQNFPGDAASYAPTVGSDKLLQRLQTMYPHRRFEEVDFAAIKKRTAG